MNQKPVIYHALALLFSCATAATAESFYKQDNEALKMQIETLQGIDYLLIETGEFNTKGGPDWKSPWMAMKRQ